MIISNLNVILIKTDDEKTFFHQPVDFSRYAFTASSCKEDELPVSGEGNVANNELPVRLAETDYNPDNTYYLLNDNESQDVYFDSGQRSFYVSRPLQFGMDDEHCFQLRFYSPRALKNVTFWARIDGYEEEFKFMSLEKIMPFQQLRVHIPFATKDLTAYTRSGKKIRIMANPYLTEENLTFTVECDDPYWTRLQSIRCNGTSPSADTVTPRTAGSTR